MTSSNVIDLSGFLNRISEAEIIDRYRRKYGLGKDVGIAHVRHHAELEYCLTQKLLASPKGERSRVFKNAYSRLYDELHWLAGTGVSFGAEHWAALMKPGARVYELGSGAGYMITTLSQLGYECTATELSDVRKEVTALSADKSLEWRSTDGVQLTAFEKPGSFDYIISNQVVEHLHPDDISEHFREAEKLLPRWGAYIVRTPHRLTGPHDLSHVFACETAKFMHLHEFTNRDLLKIARECGFKTPASVFVLKKTGTVKASKSYFFYLVFLETVLSKIGHKSRMRLLPFLARYLRFGSNVWVVLSK